jgi:hypothetical protein
MYVCMYAKGGDRVGGRCKNYFLGKFHATSMNFNIIAVNLRPISTHEDCFLDLTPCNLLYSYQSVEGTCSLIFMAKKLRRVQRSKISVTQLNDWYKLI